MATRVRAISPSLAAWQYPAPELANLSAVPEWLRDSFTTGGNLLYVSTGMVSAGSVKVEVGDWLIWHGDRIEHVPADQFSQRYEVI